MVSADREPAAEVPPLGTDPRVAAFATLERVLDPERWDDPAELIRAAFLVGWHAGALWRAGISGGPGRPRLDAPRAFPIGEDNGQSMRGGRPAG